MKYFSIGLFLLHHSPSMAQVAHKIKSPVQKHSATQSLNTVPIACRDGTEFQVVARGSMLFVLEKGEDQTYRPKALLDGSYRAASLSADSILQTLFSSDRKPTDSSGRMKWNDEGIDVSFLDPKYDEASLGKLDAYGNVILKESIPYSMLKQRLGGAVSRAAFKVLPFVGALLAKIGRAYDRADQFSLGKSIYTLKLMLDEDPQFREVLTALGKDRESRQAVVRALISEIGSNASRSVVLGILSWLVNPARNPTTEVTQAAERIRKDYGQSQSVREINLVTERAAEMGIEAASVVTNALGLPLPVDKLSQIVRQDPIVLGYLAEEIMDQNQVSEDPNLTRTYDSIVGRIGAYGTNPETFKEAKANFQESVRALRQNLCLAHERSLKLAQGQSDVSAKTRTKLTQKVLYEFQRNPGEDGKGLLGFLHHDGIEGNLQEAREGFERAKTSKKRTPKYGLLPNELGRANLYALQNIAAAQKDLAESASKIKLLIHETNKVGDSTSEEAIRAKTRLTFLLKKWREYFLEIERMKQEIYSNETSIRPTEGGFADGGIGESNQKIKRYSIEHADYLFLLNYISNVH